VADGGLNQFLFQMANIREHDSWVTEDPVEATEKAKHIVRAAISRVAFQVPLEPIIVPMNSDVLVVGGGIAGIEAALKMAQAGHHVTMVSERDPSIGGHMAQFDKTFPTLDCSACILTPKMSALGKHPNIDLLAYSEVVEVSGYVGKLQGEDQEEAALRQHRHLHRLPGLHRGVRGRQGAQRVQRGSGQPPRGLHPVRASGADEGHHRPQQVPAAHARQVQADLRHGLRAPAPSTSTRRTSSSSSR